METPTKPPPSSPSSPTTGFSVPSAEKVDGFPRRSMRRARQRRSHSSSQFRYQSSQVELTPLPLLKGKATGCRDKPGGHVEFVCFFEHRYTPQIKDKTFLDHNQLVP